MSKAGIFQPEARFKNKNQISLLPKLVKKKPGFFPARSISCQKPVFSASEARFQEQKPGFSNVNNNLWLDHDLAAARRIFAQLKGFMNLIQREPVGNDLGQVDQPAVHEFQRCWEEIRQT